MKKILVLGIFLALVAVLAAPMAVLADDVLTQGAVTVSSISFTAPSNINFGSLVLGENYAKSATNGSVTVTEGSNGADAWQVTAQELGDAGYMWLNGVIGDAGVSLTDPLRLLADPAREGLAWAYTNSDVELVWTGSGTNVDAVPFLAAQKIEAAPLDNTAGSYWAYITFAASLTGF